MVVERYDNKNMCLTIALFYTEDILLAHTGRSDNP